VTKRIVAAALALIALTTSYPAYSQHRGTSAPTSERTLSIAERQAVWSQNRREYRRRLLQDGQSSADRWLDEQARRARGESRPQERTRSRDGAENCRNVRWVNRATPGFGGGAMTMSRVPICVD